MSAIADFDAIPDLRVFDDCERWPPGIWEWCERVRRDQAVAFEARALACAGQSTLPPDLPADFHHKPPRDDGFDELAPRIGDPRRTFMSEHWSEWDRRPASAAEVLAMALGTSLPTPPRGLWSGGIRLEVIAARLRGFLEKHPELSDAAKLDLCVRFPVHPDCFPVVPESFIAAARTIGDLAAELVASPDRELEAEDGQGHDELSVGGVTAPTVERPAESGNPRLGGDEGGAG